MISIRPCYILRSLISLTTARGLVRDKPKDNVLQDTKAGYLTSYKVFVRTALCTQITHYVLIVL